MYIICVNMRVIVDLKVHVRAFNCESLQGSKMRRSESFFSVRERNFFFSRKFRESRLLWIKISTLYRCIVECSSLHGFDHDIVLSMNPFQREFCIGSVCPQIAFYNCFPIFLCVPGSRTRICMLFFKHIIYNLHKYIFIYNIHCLYIIQCELAPRRK